MTSIDLPSQMRIDDEDPSLVVVVPDELLMKVFSLLPVKSLLRFKCPSKRWLHVISSDPHFIHLQSQHFKSKPPLLFFSSCLSRVESSMSSLLQSSVDMEGKLLNKFEIRKRDAIRRRLMLPTRFDLVCFIFNDEIHVCNPSTHELITLPPFLPEEVSSFGFGYIESTNEYKIVHLMAPYYEDIYGEFDPNEPTDCIVFTLGMSEDSPSSYASPWAWRNIGKSPYNVEHHQCPAFVDGALHWLINRKRHPKLLTDIEQTILAFNLENEEFRLVPRPRGCSDLDFASTNLQLVELRGLLCLSCVGEINHKMDIWMLKEYCIETRMFTWLKQYSIDLSALADTPYGSYSTSDVPEDQHDGIDLNLHTFLDIRCRSYSETYVPRDIQDDGDKVLIETWDRRSFYYHVQTTSFTGFICQKWRRSFFAFYTESLCSLRYVLQKRLRFDQITGITHSQSQELAYMDDPPIYIVRVFAIFDPLSETSNRSSYGGYLTDFRGGFVAIEGKKVVVLKDFTEAKAKAILCGLQLAREQGIQRVALVSNAKELVDAINTGERQSSERLQQILTEISDLLSEFN